jgi:hypothetical protein
MSYEQTLRRSLSCCKTGSQFLQFHPEDCTILSPFTTSKGVLRRLPKALIDYLSLYIPLENLPLINEDVTIVGEGLQNKDLCSGPLSREGSFSCHTCCDTVSIFPVSSEGSTNLVASYDKQGDAEDLL